MRNKNLMHQCIYRGVWAVVAFVGTILTFTENFKFLGGSGHPPVLYYTSWTTWLCTVVAITLFVTTLLKLLKGRKEGYNILFPTVKFCANIMAIATFIVSAFVLSDKIWMAAYWTSAGSIFKHFLLPILTVVDCVLFDERNKMPVWMPLAGVVPSLFYWFIVMLRASIWAKSVSNNPLVYMNPANYECYFPYSFTNILPKFWDPINQTYAGGHTLGGLCGMLAGILAGLIIIGYVFWVCDKLHKENGKIVFDKNVHSFTEEK